MNSTGNGTEAARAVVDGLWAGCIGWTVRCTPRRRTVMAPAPGGGLLFGKLRRGRKRDAIREWRWLHELPGMGFSVPEPLALQQRRRDSLVVTRGLPGRSLQAWLWEARGGAERARAARYLAAVVAPLVRRLHDRGLVFRDLYCNHLFADGLDSGEPALLDVERVFRPRWRRHRWRVKDLAGLLASAPDTVSRTTCLRFLHAYLGGPGGRWKRLARAVLRKAARIRGHRPKYG